ncbi:MAG: BRO family protein [Lachnospiraceae bacterium]|nr:BRO family protein [Lachnospiraceae bacterium]
MSELQIFSNPEFGKIRTLMIESEPWAVGKDVATALGYSNTADAIQKHVDDEDKLTSQIAIAGQNRNVVIINESGLYSLILSSKLPNAKKFKRWITSEVLPTLRKTGSYSLPQADPEPQRTLTTDDYLRAASLIAGCKNERLPYVLGFIRKTGMEIPQMQSLLKESNVNPDKDPVLATECARLINAAINEYGKTLRTIGRLVGLEPTQITRIRSGASIPTTQRSQLIIDALKKELPEIE